LNHSAVILDKKLPPQNEGPKYHNISKYLEELKNWKEKVNGRDFSIEDYKIDKILEWNSSIRYMKVKSNDEDNIIKKSKDALSTSIQFCEKVLLCGDEVSQFKRILEPKNINEDK